MSDTNRENDPMDEFLSTLGDDPQETKVLRVPEVIPTTQDDAANTESNAAPVDQTPLEGSDAEAYAALKAKRAERRRKKLVRRGIVIGVAAVVIGGGAIAINILGKEPEQTMEAVTDFAVQGDFETIVDAKERCSRSPPPSSRPRWAAKSRASTSLPDRRSKRATSS